MTLKEAIERFGEKYKSNPQYKEIIEKHQIAQKEQKDANAENIKEFLEKIKMENYENNPQYKEMIERCKIAKEEQKNVGSEKMKEFLEKIKKIRKN